MHEPILIVAFTQTCTKSNRTYGNQTLYYHIKYEWSNSGNKRGVKNINQSIVRCFQFFFLNESNNSPARKQKLQLQSMCLSQRLKFERNTEINWNSSVFRVVFCVYDAFSTAWCAVKTKQKSQKIKQKTLEKLWHKKITTVWNGLKAKTDNADATNKFAVVFFVLVYRGVRKRRKKNAAERGSLRMLSFIKTARNSQSVHKMYRFIAICEVKWSELCTYANYKSVFDCCFCSFSLLFFSLSSLIE